MKAASKLDPATLPNDPELLKTMLLDYAEALGEAARKLQERDERITRMDVMIRRFQRWQFGQKAERVPDGQLIFAWYGTREAEPPAEAERAPRARRRPKRGGYRVIPAEIPRQIVVEDLPPEEKRCPGCGAERACIGYEESKRLDYTPASFFERILRRAKYACKPCGKHLRTAPLSGPIGPIERGWPGYGLIAQVLVAKYLDHIPCYRQSRIYARSGVEIPRSTLCDWVGQAVLLLEPIVRAMRGDVLRSGILKTDDTIIRLLVKGLRKTAQARLWGYLGDAHHNQVVYEFTTDRKQEHPLRFLAKYKGRIQADAYQGYDKLFTPGSEREELGCMAHARRYFFDARDTDLVLGGTALGYVRMLYEVEWAAKKAEMKAPERLALRQEKAVPILRDFKAWLDREALKLLPQSAIAQAFGYALNQWEALSRYAGIGEAEIDNNAMERAMRGAVMGRRNYLFVGSEAGGRWAAVTYSLVESCKLNGVEPYRYLRDVLRRVWTHPQSKIDELMPRLWKPDPA
jgi:transposase